MKNGLISIVVPMYFEEESAEECYLRLSSAMKENGICYELVFVNDGSTDKTMEILERIALYDKCVKVISLSRNFGHQAAITAGMDKAVGDAVVVIDGDLQDPPELIPQMVKLWEEGFEVVYAKRMRRQGESWFKLATAKLFYRLLDRMSSVKIPVDTGDFRLMDRKVVEALRRMPEHNRFVRGMVSWVGFKQTPIMYEREERFAGETKYPLKKMLKLAFDGIISFSAKPVVFVENLGASAICISVLLLVYLVLGKVTDPDTISGTWLAVIDAAVFLGGVQLLCLGMIGEYITRIYDECRERPLYIIEKEINTDGEQQKRVV